MGDIGERTYNPWVSIWTQPRATIQQIVDTDPTSSVRLLAALAGFSQALDRASMRNLGDTTSLPAIFGFSAFFGAIGGVISLYLGSVLIWWTGKWLRGQASLENVCAAIAWSSVPQVWALLLWIPQIALFGQELFTSETPHLDAHPSLLLVLLGFSAIEMVIGVWSMVVFLKCLGQVQGFSAWRALGNFLLSAVIVLAAVALVVAGFLLAWRM